jgi:hypothetical protein
MIIDKSGLFSGVATPTLIETRGEPSSRIRTAEQPFRIASA